MLRVGLTGGLASGKSFVGHTLERVWVALLDPGPDEIGHSGGSSRAEAFVGHRDQGIRPAGSPHAELETIDRRGARASAGVSRKPERLEVLNRLVHPPVRARIQRQVDEAHAERSTPWQRRSD